MLNRALLLLGDQHRQFDCALDALAILAAQMLSHAQAGTATLGASGDASGAERIALLAGIIEYLVDFTQHSHMPREDACLFAHIRRRSHEADALITELMRQHGDIAAKVDVLQHALTLLAAPNAATAAQQHPSPQRAQDFAFAAADLQHSCRIHMALEEDKLTPLALQCLDTCDWFAIAEAFDAPPEDEDAASARRRRQQIFPRIINLAAPTTMASTSEQEKAQGKRT